jgi:hypothetical protein
VIAKSFPVRASVVVRAPFGRLGDVTDVNSPLVYVNAYTRRDAVFEGFGAASMMESSCPVDVFQKNCVA